MPCYDYQCECGRSTTEYMKMCGSDEAPPVYCPDCERRMVRQVVRPHTDLKEFHTPIEMYSIALEDRNEIRAFKRRCPDVDISDDPRDEMYGVPVARSRHAKMQALKAANYSETN